MKQNIIAALGFALGLAYRCHKVLRNSRPYNNAGFAHAACCNPREGL